MREAILEGEIAPGTIMSQVALADDLGVSRTPLREALRMLQSEGLVDAQANRRVTVRPISATDLEELVVMRVALETEAVRLSVDRLQPEDIAALEGRLAEMAHFAEAKDYERWQAPHTAFHRGLTAPAGARVNAHAAAALRPLRALPARAHRALAQGVADRRPPRDPRRGKAGDREKAGAAAGRAPLRDRVRRDGAARAGLRRARACARRSRTSVLRRSASVESRRSRARPSTAPSSASRTRAPVGALRWAPPEPVAVGGRARRACVRAAGAAAGAADLRVRPGADPGGRRGLPDLNVWTPPGDGPWPVLVLAIGGGWTIGWPGSPVYDGAALAEAAKASWSSRSPTGSARSAGAFGNWGLLDHVAVLEWVRARSRRSAAIRRG